MKNITKPGNMTRDNSNNSDSFIESTSRLSLNEAQAQIRNRFELSLLAARIKQIEKQRCTSTCALNRQMNMLKQIVSDMRCSTGNSNTTNTTKPVEREMSATTQKSFENENSSFRSVSTDSDDGSDDDGRPVSSDSMKATIRNQYNNKYKYDSRAIDCFNTTCSSQSIESEQNELPNQRPKTIYTYHERKLSIGDDRLRRIYNKLCDERDCIPPRDVERIRHLQAKDPIFAKRYKTYLSALNAGKAPYFDTNDARIRVIISKTALNKQKTQISDEVYIENTTRENPYVRSQKQLNAKVTKFLKQLPIY